MMGKNDKQTVVWHTVQIEDLVPAAHSGAGPRARRGVYAGEDAAARSIL